MSYKDDQDLIIKSARWAARTCGELQDAGASVDHFMKSYISDELIAMMVRNGLEIKYVRTIR